jgi:hypothetical protein
MARLKVKQISDFTSEVQSLLASDLSGLAAVDSAQSVLIADNASAIAANDGDITNLVAVDSAQSVLIADNASAIAANDGDITDLASVDSAQSVLIADNTTAIESNDTDITALQGVDSAQSSLIVKLQGDVANNDTDITALQGVDSAQSVLISDNATAITAILDGASTDLDQFAEVVAYVNSVSSTGDLDLTNFIATSNANDSTHSTAIASNLAAILANDGEIAELERLMALNDADNLVLHTESSTQSTAIAANLASIGVNEGAIGALENSVDSLESIDSLLSAEIAALGTSLEEGDKMLHQEGTFLDTVRFTLPAAVRFGTNDDIHVHVNGHTIKPFVGEFGDEAARSTDHGWYTTDGINFQFVNIGYDLEASDVLYVQAVEA